MQPRLNGHLKTISQPNSHDSRIHLCKDASCAQTKHQCKVHARTPIQVIELQRNQQLELAEKQNRLRLEHSHMWPTAHFLRICYPTSAASSERL